MRLQQWFLRTESFILSFTLLVAVLLSGCATSKSTASTSVTITNEVRITRSFDSDWRFLKSDAEGAEQPNFDDSSWRQLEVPHDWSIEGPYAQTNSTRRGGGYLPAGVGWYRKHFTLPEIFVGRRVFIEFDSVMANSDVWINGHHLGKRPYGYVSFSYDLTGHVLFGAGKTNIIAVRADNTRQPASRWYAGAGIYRHVRLVVKQSVHIEQWGVLVTTPEVSAAQATVSVRTTLANQSNRSRQVKLQTILVAPDGREVGSIETGHTLQPGGTEELRQTVEITKPEIWDIENPHLYQAVSKVFDGDELIDDQRTSFGIRHFEFKADTGFWLNGRTLKLKGVCLHHDGGGVGAAVPLRLWERRLERLIDIGVNAIRVGHAPMAPEFYDLCDRMGILVMDETFDTWTASKPNGEQGYNRFFREWWEVDTRDVVLRDRNHPSIIIWSVGNEIRDNLQTSGGFKKLTNQRDLIHEFDGTRPVTMALFRPNVQRVYDNGFADLMDVVGQNYRENELVAAHRDKPERKVLGTENRHDRTTWLALRDNNFMAGQFLWTGVDYLGEADWPAVMSTSGLLDSTSEFRPRAYQRQSWWSDKPMVHIARVDQAWEGDRRASRRGTQLFSNWTPRDSVTASEIEIEVYSNCDSVELSLNGNSLGSKSLPSDASPRTWKVPFEGGTLNAIGRNSGRIAARHELVTSGKPARIVLGADVDSVTQEWNDVAYITATVVDGNGTRCAWADHLITFEISGPGEIVAVENGDHTSHASFQGSERSAFEGRCGAIIRASALTGEIEVRATSPGLDSAIVEVKVAPRIVHQ